MLPCAVVGYSQQVEVKCNETAMRKEEEKLRRV